MTVLALAAAASSAFNLICSGTLTVQSLLVNKTEPYSYTYRFDLAQNKWCESECKATHEILRVQPTQIILVDEKADTPREKSFAFHMIDRETGKETIVRNSQSNLTGPMLMKWQGQCAKAPFTGFPEFKTQF